MEDHNIMAENKPTNAGFVTQGQSGQGGGGGVAPTVATPGDDQSKKTAEMINKAIDGLKKYLTEVYLIEDSSEIQIKEHIKYYMDGGGFSDRKLSDSPTDAYSLVNRRYVTNNGATASRPGSPITGQFYFNTTTTKPEWYTGATWVTPSVMV